MTVLCGRQVGLRQLGLFFWREVMAAFRIRCVPNDVHHFFRRIVSETVQHREAHGVERADMLNLLIHLKNEGYTPPDAENKEAAETGKGASFWTCRLTDGLLFPCNFSLVSAQEHRGSCVKSAMNEAWASIFI